MTSSHSARYVSGTPREGVKRIALEIMKAGEIGEFIVRDIESAPEALGISVKMSSQVRHQPTGIYLKRENHDGGAAALP